MQSTSGPSPSLIRHTLTTSSSPEESVTVTLVVGLGIMLCLVCVYVFLQCRRFSCQAWSVRFSSRVPHAVQVYPVLQVDYSEERDLQVPPVPSSDPASNVLELEDATRPASIAHIV